VTASKWQAELEAARANFGPYGVSSVEEMKRHAGVAFLRGILEGRVPQAPITKTLNFALIEVDKGRAVFQGEPLHEFYNPIGTVHGGWPSTLLDSCMGCAVHSTLAAGQGYITVELKVNLIRPLSHATGPVRAEGKVINAGRTIAIAEGRLVGPEGRLYAHGTTTCLIFDL
jgi:uncharacterized protein (TIGR00369 family)